MKIATIIAGLLLSVVSNATVLKWSDVQGNPQYLVDAKSIPFKNSNPAALGTVYKRLFSFSGYAQACVSGNMIFGGTKQSCVKFVSDSDGNKTCVAYAANDLYAPTSGTRTICVDEDSEGNCNRTKTINYTIDTLVTAKVYKKALMVDENNGADRGLVGYVKLQLPTCGSTVVPAN